MSKYIATLAWTSFFALWWLMLLGALEPNLATIPSLLLFAFIGACASTPRTTKPPTGGNGRHARRERRPRKEGR